MSCNAVSLSRFFSGTLVHWCHWLPIFTTLDSYISVYKTKAVRAPGTYRFVNNTLIRFNKCQFETTKPTLSSHPLYIPHWTVPTNTCVFYSLFYSRFFQCRFSVPRRSRSRHASVYMEIYWNRDWTNWLSTAIWSHAHMENICIKRWLCVRPFIWNNSHRTSNFSRFYIDTLWIFIFTIFVLLSIPIDSVNCAKRANQAPFVGIFRRCYCFSQLSMGLDSTTVHGSDSIGNLSNHQWRLEWTEFFFVLAAAARIK